MTEPVDPKAQRARERREFWREYIVPTAKAIEAFAWRVTIGGLVIYLVFRSMCPSTGDAIHPKATATAPEPATKPSVGTPPVLSEVSNED